MKKITNLVKGLIDKHSLSGIPIDLQKLACEYGIHIAYHNLPDDVSGALDLRDTDKKIILVNSNHSKNRQRFTVAHELGHYFLHHTVGVHIDKKLFFRDATSAQGTNIVEKEANRFAAELLLPEDSLIADLNSISDLDSEEELKEIANRYCVSTIALSFRIAQLKKIPDIW